jgi:hypothetical protein
MDMYKVAQDLSEVVEPRAFISPENVEKLRKMSSAQFNSFRNRLNQETDLGQLNLYKAAYLHGKNRFTKEAENLMIWKGIDELKKKAMTHEKTAARPFIPMPKGQSFLGRLGQGWKNWWKGMDDASQQAWDIQRRGGDPGTFMDKLRYAREGMDPAQWSALRNTALGGAGLAGLYGITRPSKPTIVAPGAAYYG